MRRAQRNQFQRHDQADDVLRQRRANAAAMRQDQVALQGGHVLRRDAHRGEFSEAGIDAVDRVAACCDLADPLCRALGNAGPKTCRRARRDIGAVDRFQIGQRNRAGVKRDGHSHGGRSCASTSASMPKGSRLAKADVTADLPPCGGDVRQDRGGQRRALISKVIAGNPSIERIEADPV
jgi:hypothetical protein